MPEPSTILAPVISMLSDEEEELVDLLAEVIVESIITNNES